MAPFDANIVRVGTGEANPRNNVSRGDGVRELEGEPQERNSSLPVGHRDWKTVPRFSTA